MNPGTKKRLIDTASETAMDLVMLTFVLGVIPAFCLYILLWRDHWPWALGLTIGSLTIKNWLESR